MSSRRARTRASGGDGAVVKVSVPLSASVHLRLRVLATLRQQPAGDIVAGLIEQATASVRLPSLGGPTSPAERPAESEGT